MGRHRKRPGSEEKKVRKNFKSKMFCFRLRQSCDLDFATSFVRSFADYLNALNDNLPDDLLYDPGDSNNAAAGGGGPNSSGNAITSSTATPAVGSMAVGQGQVVVPASAGTQNVNIVNNGGVPTSSMNGINDGTNSVMATQPMMTPQQQQQQQQMRPAMASNQNINLVNALSSGNKMTPNGPVMPVGGNGPTTTVEMPTNGGMMMMNQGGPKPPNMGAIMGGGMQQQMIGPNKMMIQRPNNIMMTPQYQRQPGPQGMPNRMMGPRMAVGPNGPHQGNVAMVTTGQGQFINSPTVGGMIRQPQMQMNAQVNLPPRYPTPIEQTGKIQDPLNVTL